MTTAYWIFGGIIALVTFGPIMLPHGRHTPRHDSTRAIAAGATTRGSINAASINYSGNPYRAGAYVYVMEDSAPSPHDWQGTFLGMSDGMALVRDQDSLIVTHVNRDQLYSATK